MPSRDPTHGLKPSVLDRLTDPASRGTAARPGYSEELMIAAVRLDLEELLNTRRAPLFEYARPGDGTAAGVRGLLDQLEVEQQAYPELISSVAAFGLPELTSAEASKQTREQIAVMIEKIIGWFEPRLREVRASLLPASDPNDRNVRFRIEAELNVEPAEPVAFETTLNLSTGRHKVEPAVL
jgi:type VI secretion system protein ImpF